MLMGGTAGCSASQTCMSHGQDLSYPAMLGCCSSSSCSFVTTCADASQIAATPSFTDTPQPFTTYCTETDYPACATDIYSDVDVTFFLCLSTSGIGVVYTTGLSYYSTGTVVDRYDAYLTPANDDVLSSYTATFSTPSASSTSSSSSSDEPKESNESNAGPIAGGVVGGVAGVALIAAAGFFFFRKKPQPDNDPVLPDHDYKPVPAPVPAQLADSQMPPEMAPNDPVHNLPEAEGTAYEMRSNQVQGKTFVAELPGDFHPKSS